MGGKKRENNFFSRNTRISQAKNNEKKSFEKVRKHVFYKHTNIVKKNRGKKARKNFFQKLEYRVQKTMEKNRLEKVQIYVFYKHTNIVTKKSEEKN